MTRRKSRRCCERNTALGYELCHLSLLADSWGIRLYLFAKLLAETQECVSTIFGGQLYFRDIVSNYDNHDNHRYL